MWNVLKRTREKCEKVQDFLEDSVAQTETGGLEEWMAHLPSERLAHIADCGDCGEKAEDFFATRAIFKGAASRAEDGGPEFTARVMRAIAVREREMVTSASAWLEIPRFASRLAWITAVVLLAGSTWMYERGTLRSSPAQSGSSGQESIFETAPAPAQDDVLISMAENSR